MFARKIWVVAVLLSIVISPLLIAAVPVIAEGDEIPVSIPIQLNIPLVNHISVTIEENSEWSFGVSLVGEKDKTISSEWLAALGVPAKLDPSVGEMVGKARQEGIYQLKVLKKGWRLWGLVNNQPVIDVEVEKKGQELLDKTLEPYLPESNLAAWGIRKLIEVAGTVYLNLGEVPQLPKIESTSAAKTIVVNTINLGATINLSGTLLSGLGLTQAELNSIGLSLPASALDSGFVASVLTGTKKIEAQLTPDGLHLLNDGNGLAKVRWDSGSRKTIYDLAPKILRIIGAEVAEWDTYAQALEKWIADTEITVVANVGGKPGSEGLPKLDLKRPVRVELTNEGTLKVEGVYIGELGGVAPIGDFKVAARWQDRRLRWTAQGMPMPYLRISTGWLKELTGLQGINKDVYGEYYFLLGKLEDILGNSNLGVVLNTDQDVPDYVVKYTAEVPTIQGEINAILSRDARLRVGTKIPGIAEIVPTTLGVKLDLLEGYIPAGLEKIIIAYGPRGLEATVNTSTVSLFWDNELLTNAAKVAGDLTGQDFTSYVQYATAGGAKVNILIVDKLPPTAEETRIKQLEDQLKAFEERLKALEERPQPGLGK